MTLGKQIASLRKSAGYTQQSLATALSMSLSAIKSIELSRREPSIQLLKQIATLLNVEITSVRMSKYRLKQKFSLSKNDDLQDFLKSVV